MKVEELINYLSQFDPECSVEVLVEESDWVRGPDDESVEEICCRWSDLDPDCIKQSVEGVIRLGIAYDDL